MQKGPDHEERWPRGANLDGRDERRDSMQAFKGGILAHLKVDEHGSARSSSGRGSPTQGASGSATPQRATLQRQGTSGYAGDSEGGWGDKKEAETPKESSAFVYPEVRAACEQIPPRSTASTSLRCLISPVSALDCG